MKEIYHADLGFDAALVAETNGLFSVEGYNGAPVKPQNKQWVILLPSELDTLRKLLNRLHRQGAI